MRRARSTATLAMLTVPAPIDVSVRTRLATVKALAHAAPEHPLQRPGGERRVVGLLDLAEDLRLAEHHRVEARGDAEDVGHGLVARLS